MDRIRILIFVPHYVPGYKSGGPIRTIANLTEELGEEFVFGIVTSDRDATDLAPYSEVTADRWTRVGKAEVLYTSPKQRSARSYLDIFRGFRPDILYLNSFFHPRFTGLVLLLLRGGLLPPCRTVVAPRGEFATAALSIKPWRKRAYVLAAKILGLDRNVVWQASSSAERDDIERIWGAGSGRIYVVPNVPGGGGAANKWPRKDPSVLRVVFLSRIAPMKNLEGALQALMSVKSTVEFNIYGPVRDEAYWRRCELLVQMLPHHVTVRRYDSVPHNEVAAVLGRHDLFFLPTLGENFGHVIIESLLAGTPVLISDRTPWQNLEEYDAGWVVSLNTPTRFASIIDRCAAMSADEFAELRYRAVEFGRGSSKSGNAIVLNRQMFTSCLS